ncbi:unnamed protein product [Ixodes hexagonus]
MDKDSLKKQIENLRYQAQMERWPLSKSIQASRSGRNTTHVNIDSIYREVYKPTRNKAIADKKLEWTLFLFIVKGKDVKTFVQKAGEGQESIGVGEGFVVKLRDPGPNDLTIKRLSACFLYDNCMNAAEDVTSNPPAGRDEVNKTFTGTAETLGEMSKYIPSMSTSIPWQKIAETLTSPTMKEILLKNVQFACGPGLNFVWRIYQAENGAIVEDAGPAFAIGAYYMDLAALNSQRRKAKKAPFSAADAFKEIVLMSGGTFSGLLNGCVGLTGPANIVDSPKFDEIANAIHCPLSTTFGGQAAQRARAALASIVPGMKV